MSRYGSDDYDFDRPRDVGRRKRRKRGAGLPKFGPVAIGLGVAGLLVLAAFVAPGTREMAAALGLLALIAGDLWLLGIAAKDSVGQMLLCLFVPLYALHYALSNFAETKWSFGLFVLGAIVSVACTVADKVRPARPGAPAGVADRGWNEPPPPPAPVPAPRTDPPKAGAPGRPDPSNPARPFAADPQAKAAGKTAYLVELTPFAYQAGPWKLGVGARGDGRPMTVRGQEYRYGVSMHPPQAGAGACRVSFAPGKEFKRFRGWVAINDDADPRGTVVFAASGDGRRLWTSGGFNKAGAAAEFDIAIAGVEVLTLETWVKDGDYYAANAVWLDPWLER